MSRSISDQIREETRRRNEQQQREADQRRREQEQRWRQQQADDQRRRDDQRRQEEIARRQRDIEEARKRNEWAASRNLPTSSVPSMPARLTTTLAYRPSTKVDIKPSSLPPPLSESYHQSISKIGSSSSVAPLSTPVLTASRSSTSLTTTEKAPISNTSLASKGNFDLRNDTSNLDGRWGSVIRDTPNEVLMAASLGGMGAVVAGTSLVGGIVTGTIGGIASHMASK